MRSIIGASVLALFMTGGTAASLGCSDCSTQGQTPILFTDGNVNQSRTFYESGEVDGEMLHFPQGRTYDFEHGLGARPATVDIFLSFRQQLTEEGGKTDSTAPNNVAPTAGNQAVIESWNEEVIRVRNDTCANFYIRLVAIADPEDVAAGAAGAAGAANVDQ